VDVKGDPANGDAFTVAPSTRQSLFTTLADAAAALNAGTAGTTAGRTRLQQGIIAALGNIDQAMEQALVVRTGTGARLREVEAVADVTSGLALEYDRRLSELRDLDYAKAISDLTRQQQALEAAQKSYKSVTALSLFDYL
jgi:flagellar hook-associated protein 3 FlgL